MHFPSSLIARSTIISRAIISFASFNGGMIHHARELNNNKMISNIALRAEEVRARFHASSQGRATILYELL
jgi:hypothetical protein